MTRTAELHRPEEYQGTVRFMHYRNICNFKVMLKFLKRIIYERGREISLIVDRHLVHCSQEIQRWLTQQANVTELFFLPTYRPELNPSEYINCDVKRGSYFKPPTRNQQQLFPRLLSHVRKLKKFPERIKRYFKHLNFFMQLLRFCKPSYCRVNRYL